MKNVLLGSVLIILIGIGGLVYRNAKEHPLQPIVCPLDALVCPDGTSVSRTGNSCTFPTCPPPNVSLAGISASFALPNGFEAVSFGDEPSVVAVYAQPATASSTGDATLIIRRYAVNASSTALSVIQQTALGGASGMPVPATSFSSTMIGTHRFTVVTVERFEGVVDTAYYLARSEDVLRFDAIDREVTNWTDPDLEIATLPAHAAMAKLLGTLQGQ